MKLSVRNVLLLIAVGAGLLAAFGCSQNDDVVKPQDKATLTLRPINLPELDTLYAYEFWALAVDVDDTTYTSLGKFLWDNDLYLFRTLDGAVADSLFELPEAYFSYDYFAVTVEDIDDPAPLTPSGVFMLVDEVVDPVTRPVEMKFPISMFDALGSFIVDTPTDDTLDTDNDEKGIWLCAQVETQRYLHDTLGVFNYDTVMVPVADDDLDKYGPDTIGIIFPPDSNWTIIDTTVIFGYDTIPHRRVNIEWEVISDTLYDYILFADYDIDSISTDPSHPRGLIVYNDYQTSLENLPDISSFGWCYSAWVFHEYFPAAADLPVMIPFGYSMQSTITAAPDWSVLPLGAFNRPDTADLSNPHISNREVPDFPGEDFILDLPTGYDELNFRYIGADDLTGGSWGAVVVGMEPDPNLVAVDASKNFPLFFLSSPLPDAELGDVPGFLFHNYSTYLPEIVISVEFHE